MNIIVTPGQIKKIYPFATDANIAKYLPWLNKAMSEFQINTPQRVRMFLAQVGHESGQLRYVEELASGAAYEGRMDLGNTQPGDGVKYKGRGLIQITGRSNYSDAGTALGVAFVSNPNLLAAPEFAARSAGWFWASRNLNALADMGQFELITKRINGGLNGYADRYKLYQNALNTIVG